jgi:ribosomal RNA small subunit methyltransferase A/dephospho-CoA kinase
MSAPRKFLLVGLTGGIATGKSTVSKMLRELGAEIIDADQIARRVVEPGQPAWREIVEEFGRDVLSPDETLDRRKLGAIVFANPERRRRLEAITHPAIRARVKARVDELAAQGFAGIAFYDAAILIEALGHQDMDRIVVVMTDEATQLARLGGRDGTDEAEGRRKIASQMPLAEKAKLADHIIDNSGDREATAEQVRRVFATLMDELAARHGAVARAERRPTVPSENKRRALGQHFLRDGAIARAIVDLVAPTPADMVVEIGPGDGALTGILAGRAGRVVALEVDRALGAALRARFPAVEVLDADARTWDYAGLTAPPGGRVLIVGNLPYSVGKPILSALVGAGDAIDEMALMLQREVAERVAAPPGGKTYGSLSVFTQLRCDVRLALRVPAGAFRPPPKVESAVLHLRVLRGPRVALADERRFETVVRAAFAQRRKVLANALGAGLGLPLEVVRRAASLAGVDPSRRAETLSLQEFADLTARLS